MKNIFYILLLLPTIIFAQYPSNSGQKITLGEQTTADGLVYRGVANDTNVITPFSDTSAYIILDTVNSKFYHYNRTTTYWALAGGGVSVSSFSAGTTGLTPSTATTGAVTLGGTLAVANGGTGNTSLDAADIVTKSGTQTISGAKTFTSAVTATRFNPTANTATGTGMYLPAANALGLSTNDLQRIHITSAGDVGFGVIPFTGYNFQVSTNSGSGNEVIFVVNNNGTTPSSATTARFDFGVFSDASNYVATNTVLGQTNFIGQANDARYVAGKIDVIVTNAGNVGRGAGHSGIMRFYTKPTNENGVSERMRINEVGNVGIGTASPAAKLQVKGSTNASEFALRVEDSGSNTLLSVQNNSSIKFQYGTGGATVTDGIAIKRFSPDVASRSTMEISGTSSDWVSGKGLVFNNHTLGIIFGAQTHFSSAVSTNQLWIGDSQIGSVDDFIVFSTGTPGFVDILATKYAGGPYPNMRISAPNISFFTKTGATWPDGGGSSSYGTEIMTLMGSSNIKMNSVVYNNTTTSNTRTLFIGGDYTIGGISSIRASKKNIENVSNVDWLYELNPVTFNYRKKDLEGNYLEEVYEDKNYGLIAEDTKPVADFLINYNDKEDGTKEMIGIEYSRLITPLLKAVQELSAEIDILKQEIINLKNK